MLRIQRLTQLLIALCASAFLSALISLAIYRVLSMTALPLAGSDVLHDLEKIQDINKLREITNAFVGAAFELRDSGAFPAYWGLGFVLVWSLVLGAVAVATHRRICKVSIAPALPEPETLIDRALSGKLELWKVFWGVYVALSLLLFFVTGGVLQLSMQAEIVKSSMLINVLAVPIAIAVPATIYLYSAILVWRSAKNTSSIVWHYLAKAVVITFTMLPLLKSIIVVSSVFR